jgi:hypothetical protein
MFFKLLHGTLLKPPRSHILINKTLLKRASFLLLSFLVIPSARLSSITISKTVQHSTNKRSGCLYLLQLYISVMYILGHTPPWSESNARVCGHPRQWDVKRHWCGWEEGVETDRGDGRRLSREGREKGHALVYEIIWLLSIMCERRLS